MIPLKTEEEIEIIRESSLLVGKTLAEVAKAIRPGVKTVELDAIAESFIRDHQGVPGFKGYWTIASLLPKVVLAISIVFSQLLFSWSRWLITKISGL